MRLLFGRCVLDTDTRELTLAGKSVHLTARMFELLDVLLDSRPRAISKADLVQRIWPDAFVSEAALSNLVADLRSAIGDDARDPALIRTVHRFGYAFSGKVAAAADLARGPSHACRLIWDAREIALAEGENILGRIPEAVVWIDRPGVSRRHARVTVQGRAATIEDLASKNGTFLNGRRIAGIEPVTDGSTIGVGDATLVFRVYALDASTQTSFRR